MTGGEIFVRSSDQKQWLNPDVYEKVYEEVYVNEKEQLITFIGATKLPSRAEELEPQQPLFHVQHGVTGEENNPINTWRIIHLTAKNDFHLIEAFKKLNDPLMLPGFIKEYIDKDLNITIQHK